MLHAFWMYFRFIQRSCVFNASAYIHTHIRSHLLCQKCQLMRRTLFRTFALLGLNFSSNFGVLLTQVIKWSCLFLYNILMRLSSNRATKRWFQKWHKNFIEFVTLTLSFNKLDAIRFTKTFECLCVYGHMTCKPLSANWHLCGQHTMRSRYDLISIAICFSSRKQKRILSTRSTISWIFKI